MDLQTLLNSSWGTGLGIRLPGLLPPTIGNTIGAFLADAIASRRHSRISRAVRANQWVVRSGRATSSDLQQAVRNVLRHRARCLFDLYHNINRPDDLERLSPMTPEAMYLIELSRQGQRGAVIAVPHLSNFDLVLIVLGRRGFKGQVLAHAQPIGGYRQHHRAWASSGIEITPATPATSEQSLDYLKRGGLVITGIDRPIPKKQHMLTFFGRPSPLPAGHIRLALEADVPVIPAAVQGRPDGTYALKVADSIEMTRHPDPRETVRLNAEAVLAAVEGFISQAPDQWLMFYPVWPDAPSAI